MRWITLLLTLVNGLLADRSRLALENVVLRLSSCCHGWPYSGTTGEISDTPRIVRKLRQPISVIVVVDVEL